MNIKKILAGAVASVMAVSTLAVAASAAKFSSSLANAADDGNGNFQIFVVKDGTALYDGVDVTKIASVDVTLTFNATEEDWVGGAIVTQCDAASWNSIGQFATGDEGKEWNNVKSGDTLTVNIGEGAFPADSTYVILTLQNYSELTILVNNAVFKDAAGNVLLDVAAGGAAPAETEAPATEAPATEAPADTEAPATEAPADTTATVGNTSTAPSTDKGNADTGVEGVAVVAGLAIVAAGAIVVAKKRK